MKTAEKLDQIIKEEYENMNGMLVVRKVMLFLKNIITITDKMIHFM